MKKEVSPVVLIGAGIATVIVLLAIGIYVLAPHEPPVTIPPGNQSEGALKQENIRKQNAATPTDASTAKPASNSDRTGD